jgi:hydroxyacylglutathione hydrolase
MPAGITGPDTDGRLSAAAQAHAIAVTPYKQNCSLVWCPASRQAAVIDPGGDIERILGEVLRLDLTVGQILLTHGHPDHAGGAAELAGRIGVPIFGPHRADRFLLELLPGGPERWIDALHWLEDGDRLAVGEISLEVRHCPGHTPGHVVYVDRASKHAWVGDVLFPGSIGATDSAYGDREQLIRSIVGQLWPYGNAVRFTPGHGRGSTFGFEREFNPFVCDDLTELMGLTDPSLRFGMD